MKDVTVKLHSGCVVNPEGNAEAHLTVKLSAAAANRLRTYLGRRDHLGADDVRHLVEVALDLHLFPGGLVYDANQEENA